MVSTHSRPKAAASIACKASPPQLSFNTQPPEGGCRNPFADSACASGFNTQPPEGGCAHRLLVQLRLCCFNTQPPEGGCLLNVVTTADFAGFQHTAARRRLLDVNANLIPKLKVSTHSRPKAAALS